MTQPNEHKFEFKLPMFPNQKIEDNGMPCELKMDGRDMKGVTSLTMRAGSNGFTNVVVEFEASCAVECAAHLVAHMTGFTFEEQQLQLAGIFREVNEEIKAELEREGANLMDEYMAQADFVRRIIELTIERVK